MTGAPESKGAGLERSAAILFIATGSLFAAIGSVSGSLELSSLAGASLPSVLNLFASHPYLQVYGFLFEFIAGVSYVLVPRFQGRHMGRMPLVIASYVSATAGNVAFIAGGLEPKISWWLAGYLLIVLASLVYSVQTLVSLSWSGVVDGLVAVSCVSLPASASLLAASNPGPEAAFSQPLLLTALLGFAGSMIFAVELKTAGFRYSVPRAWASKIVLGTQSAGVASSIASVFFAKVLPLSSALFTCSAIISVVALRAERSALTDERRKLLPKRDLVRVRYHEICVRVALFWLVAGTVASDFWAIWPSSFALRDTFIHVTAIGFIGSTILGYGPILLPGLLSGRAPHRGLTTGPLIILASAVTVRAAGNMVQAAEGGVPQWEPVSGYLVLIAMVWFVLMAHSMSEERPA